MGAKPVKVSAYVHKRLQLLVEHEETPYRSIREAADACMEASEEFHRELEKATEEKDVESGIDRVTSELAGQREPERPEGEDPADGDGGTAAGDGEADEPDVVGHFLGIIPVYDD